MTLKTAWVPVWAVRPDGTRLEAYEVNHAGGRTVAVRQVGGRTRWWTHSAYEPRFGATPAEAIEKFRVMAERGVEQATEELEEAERLLARARTLSPDMPGGEPPA
jgi:hypothetical protein